MKDLEHKGVLLWQGKIFLLIQERIENHQVIDMDSLLCESFNKEVAECFSKTDLVKLLESSPKSRTPQTNIKILSELMIRFSEKETSIKHFLGRQSLEDLGKCLEIILHEEKFETACFIRDEISKRINE